MGFKVGDKVRIAEHVPFGMNPGEEATVTALYNENYAYNYRALVEGDGYTGFDGARGALYAEDELEAI